MSSGIGLSRKGAEGQSAQRYSENQIAGMVVDLALRIHRDLGPGLLESVYEKVIASGLRERELDVKCQVPVPVSYKNMQFDEAFRADLIVNDKLRKGIVRLVNKLPEKN